MVLLDCMSENVEEKKNIENYKNREQKKICSWKQLEKLKDKNIYYPPCNELVWFGLGHNTLVN